MIAGAVSIRSFERGRRAADAAVMEFESGFRCDTARVAIRGSKRNLCGCREKQNWNVDWRSGFPWLDKDVSCVPKHAVSVRVIAAHELSRKHRLLGSFQEICRAVSSSTSLMTPPHRGQRQDGIAFVGIGVSEHDRGQTARSCWRNGSNVQHRRAARNPKKQMRMNPWATHAAENAASHRSPYVPLST